MRGVTILLVTVAVAGLWAATPSQADSLRSPAAHAARAYLAALKTEKGSRVCPLVTRATRLAFVDEARSDGLHLRRCVPAADHALHRVGRVLGRFHVIAVEVHGHGAFATVDDEAISDSGDDTFRLLRRSDGRWLVDDS
jgi:Ser/Thr protein kinase RdoA (MazF antagonist)